MRNPSFPAIPFLAASLLAALLLAGCGGDGVTGGAGASLSSTTSVAGSVAGAKTGRVILRVAWPDRTPNPGSKGSDPVAGAKVIPVSTDRIVVSAYRNGTLVVSQTLARQTTSATLELPVGACEIRVAAMGVRFPRAVASGSAILEVAAGASQDAAVTLASRCVRTTLNGVEEGSDIFVPSRGAYYNFTYSTYNENGDEIDNSGSWDTSLTVTHPNTAAYLNYNGGGRSTFSVRTFDTRDTIQFVDRFTGRTFSYSITSN